MSFMATMLIVMGCLSAWSAPAAEAQESPAPSTTEPASEPASEPAPGPDQQATPTRPWPQQLGLRSAYFSSLWSELDTVVLVPDLATWLDEVCRWSPRLGRWPVLIEDRYYTRLFVRRFAPQNLIRRPSVGVRLPAEPAALEALVRSRMVAAWAGSGAVSEGRSMDDVYRELGWAPPGIVATSFADPAWPAAVTLSIARGQLLRTLDGDFGRPNGTMEPAEFRRLRDQVNRLFAESGWSWGRLGAELQALTLCRELPVRARASLGASDLPNLPGAPPLGSDPPVALTDLLCRDESQARTGVCGWVFGDSVRAIYMAMCSVFIERDTISLFDVYGAGLDAPPYELDVAKEKLAGYGIEVTSLVKASDADLEGWRRLVMGGVPADVLFMNTSGVRGAMDLARGTTGRTSDIPPLSRPLALHMIHSYSLQRPASPSSVGGRWLDRGVYAYVGSCEEPLLAAFATPAMVVDWVANLSPFLVAGRRYTGPMSRPWRVVTIGDPLMLIEPPGGQPRTRVKGARIAGKGETDVRTRLLEQLRGSEPPDAGCYRDLILLDQDDLARSLWNRDAATAGPAEAEAILPLLFEERRFSEFMSAYRLLEAPSPESKDMLWACQLPRLGELDSLLDLELLEESLRDQLMARDLESLMPHLVRLRGSRAARTAVESAIERAGSPLDRDQLRVLLGKY